VSRITGFNRKRIGYRNHSATIESPPQTLDDYGQRSYTTGPWAAVLSGWWCELVDLGGGEILDGVATKTATEAVLIGDSPSTEGEITTDCRAVVDGVTYGITAVRDISGANRVLRVEIRRTQ